MIQILLIVLIIITILNIILVTRSRRLKRKAKEAYQQLLQSLRDRTIDKMKAQGLYFDKTYPLISDRDVGYLFCIDSEHRMAALTDPEHVTIFPLSSISGCVIEEKTDDDPRYYQQVSIHIMRGEEEPLTIPLGTKRTKRKGMMGSFILNIAHQLQQVIEDETAADLTNQST